MSKRAILFDFGGVFMKTVDYTPRHTWDDRLGLTHGSVERIVHGSESWRAAQTGRLSVSDYWADVAQQLGLDRNDITALANDYFSGDQLDLELVEYTRHLRDQGHTIALLSNDSLALTDKLRQLGIADLFDPLIVSAQIGVMKPDSRAFQTTLDRLNRPAEAVVFIDDMPANIDSARKLGIRSIHYTTTTALQTALEPLLDTKE